MKKLQQDSSCLSGLAAILVLVQVFAMRRNVVVGGQLFSKSFRGFVEFTVPWGGREGLIAAAAVVLLLPLGAIWLASKMLPLRLTLQSSTAIGFMSTP